MATTIQTMQLVGTKGIVVDVECHMFNGLPALSIVGMANKSIDESKERVRSAFSSSKLQFPKKKITINLAPADVQKIGTSFDAAIAAAILQDMQAVQIPKGILFFGELGLDGSLRPVRGIVGKLLSARDQGYTTFVVPYKNKDQALLVPHITCIPLSSLTELYKHFTGANPAAVIESKNGHFTAAPTSNDMPDIAEVVGQERAKRALVIAAAGGHNILLSGPPGMGKSMLAKTMPSILPALTHDEALHITHIHSLGLQDASAIVQQRPFRSPHHSASTTALIGGGQHPRPGEITLAHGGVLFLDELPEFTRTAIESLRQPLEDGIVTISRAKEAVEYPAAFMLVATRNPCPCGFLGSTRECTCTAANIQSYNKKLSGPIMDRIDLHVTVDPVSHKDLLQTTATKQSPGLQKTVEKARKLQANRYGTPITTARISTDVIKQTCALTPGAEALLNTAAERLSLSPRVYMKTIKIARTIADLEESDDILVEHVSEALQYRPVSVTL